MLDYIKYFMGLIREDIKLAVIALLLGLSLYFGYRDYKSSQAVSMCNEQLLIVPQKVDSIRVYYEQREQMLQEEVREYMREMLIQAQNQLEKTEALNKKLNSSIYNNNRIIKQINDTTNN